MSESAATKRRLPDAAAFIFTFDAPWLERLAVESPTRLDRYRVEAVVPVTGEAPRLGRGFSAARLERAGGVELPAIPPDAIWYRGVKQHLLYTGERQSRELVSQSRSAMPPGEDTTAVVIPLRKTTAWWDLPQDRRQAHFSVAAAATESHTSIGMRYAGRIFRTLYSARYLGAPLEYDFVTYFEFPRSEAETFRALLGELRDRARNPEWEFVDLEHEIWMTKLA